MDPDDDVARLRKLLVGVKWKDFLEGCKVTRNGVVFIGRFGRFLGKNVVAIIAQKKFVAIVPVAEYNIALQLPSNQPVLDPKRPDVGQDIVHAAYCLEREGITKVIGAEDDQHARI